MNLVEQYFERGGAKGRFYAKSPPLCEKTLSVKCNHFDEAGWDIMTMQFSRKGSFVGTQFTERHGRTPTICRIGPARTRTDWMATPSKPKQCTLTRFLTR